MEGLVKGDVVVIRFPFSNLKEVKKRPVLILKSLKGEDILAVQITGESYATLLEVPLRKESFKQGSLKRESYVRIDKIASLEKSLIEYKIGALKQEKINEVIDKICYLLKN